jgi:hypothetical protein
MDINLECLWLRLSQFLEKAHLSYRSVRLVAIFIVRVVSAKVGVDHGS